MVASVVALAYRSMAGESLPPVSLLSIYLVSIGGGLVLARIGKLGPFEGTFGPPWFENRLRDLLVRESARANRFDRLLTVVAAHEPKSRQQIDWERHIRLSDQAIRCRDGWTVLVLPETAVDEAVVALQRVRLEANRGFEAVLVTADRAADPERLGAELHELVAHAQSPDTVTVCRDGELDRQSLIP